MKHKHYELIVQWASDPAAYNVEYRWSEDGEWNPCDAPVWDNVEYRLIPRLKMLHLNGVEFPAPERELPRHGCRYFVPAIDYDGYAVTWEMMCNHEHEDRTRLDNGLVHLTREAAEAHARAMLAAKEVD